MTTLRKHGRTFSYLNSQCLPSSFHHCIETCCLIMPFRDSPSIHHKQASHQRPYSSQPLPTIRHHLQPNSTQVPKHHPSPPQNSPDIPPHTTHAPLPLPLLPHLHTHLSTLEARSMLPRFVQIRVRTLTRSRLASRATLGILCAPFVRRCWGWAFAAVVGVVDCAHCSRKSCGVFFVLERVQLGMLRCCGGCSCLYCVVVCVV